MSNTKVSPDTQIEDLVFDLLMSTYAHNRLNRMLDRYSAYEDSSERLAERVAKIVEAANYRTQQLITNQDFNVFESRWSDVRGSYPR